MLNKAAVKLYNIVGKTLLFSPTTALFLLNKAEINKVLNNAMHNRNPQAKFPGRDFTFLSSYVSLKGKNVKCYYCHSTEWCMPIEVM